MPRKNDKNEEMSKIWGKGEFSGFYAKGLTAKKRDGGEAPAPSAKKRKQKHADEAEAPVTEKQKKQKPKQVANLKVMHLELPTRFTRVEVMELCESYNPVKVQSFRYPSRPGEYARVTFKTAARCQQAIDELNGTTPEQWQGVVEASHVRTRTETKKMSYAKRIAIKKYYAAKREAE
eukprot:NODE_5552_length_640_cov_5.364522_g5388_i0.p2 GENE.NODE_5552_length_640_cov_5.364522_g5388_i0~~NODE_5552_length_640_cov_5.364522_g5388_i0.p2  ORF type:complete len:195 (-),score=72.61 NODE_5552_length_640_cov_5.364522_g5388_i0:54-584(-)